LLTSAEFANFSGKNPNSEPQAFGDMCTYDGAMIYLYSGKDSQAQWDKTTKAMGNVNKISVTDVGDNAYAFFVDPKSEKQVGVAFVVFNKGEHTIAVSIQPPQGKNAESIREQVIAAAKVAAAKLN
jgi:hypothetical protein